MFFERPGLLAVDDTVAPGRGDVGRDEPKKSRRRNSVHFFCGGGKSGSGAAALVHCFSFFSPFTAIIAARFLTFFQASSTL